MPYAEAEKVIQILESGGGRSHHGVAEKTCHVMACDLPPTACAAPPRPHACRAPSKAAKPAPPSSHASRPLARASTVGRHWGAGLLALALLGAMSLAFLGDDIFVLIAAELDARMLGRLGCAAQRFSQPHEHAAPAPDPGVLAPRGQRGRPHRAQRRLRCLPGRHRHGAPLPSLRRRARAAPCCRSACRTPAPWPPRLGC